MFIYIFHISNLLPLLLPLMLLLVLASLLQFSNFQVASSSTALFMRLVPPCVLEIHLEQCPILARHNISCHVAKAVSLCLPTAPLPPLPTPPLELLMWSNGFI